MSYFKIYSTGYLGLLIVMQRSRRETGVPCAEASTKQYLEAMGEHWSSRWAAKTAWHTDFDNKADREAETCRTPFCSGMDMNI